MVDSSGQRTPVGKDNLVLRECILKNTDFVEGIVVYAGHESKAMMNNGGPRHKISKVELVYSKYSEKPNCVNNKSKHRRLIKISNDFSWKRR